MRGSQAYLIGKVLMPRFTVGLIPIDRPKAMDMRRICNISASIGPPDGHVPDLDGQVHACIQVGPVFRNVL